MGEHPIHSMMGITMEKIKEMVDVNAVIGNPITSPDGTVVIPVSKAAFGFGAGGSDFSGKQPKDLFGGGGGAGVTIQPIAFLVISNGDVKVIPIEMNDNTADRMVGLVPEVIQIIGDLFKKGKSTDSEVTNPVNNTEQKA